jgi:integrase
MAWLERKGTMFRIRFRFGGKKQFVALKTAKEREANSCLARFEENLRLAERGRLEIPDDADVGLFLLSDGKLNHRPLDECRPAPVTLGQLFAGYRDNYPKRAKEENTRYTERIHMNHLERLLGAGTQLHSITAKMLQGYVATRSQETSKFRRMIGSATIKKELGTLTAVWNQWAIPQGLASASLPTKLLTFDKGRAKPPFQTREQIERQIARGGLSPEEHAALWDSLFLTLPEIGDVLEFVRQKKLPPFVYPLFAFAAHTGARRSEMLRSRMTDFDFEANVVTIREKKRERDKVETYRTVPMTPTLANAMRSWFAVHSGGPFTVCTPTGTPISVQQAAKAFVRVLLKSTWEVLPGWHSFRHSFISNCVAKGVDQRLIDQWVGHTTEAMRRRYSHLIPRTSQEALRTVFSG